MRSVYKVKAGKDVLLVNQHVNLRKYWPIFDHCWFWKSNQLTSQPTNQSTKQTSIHPSKEKTNSIKQTPSCDDRSCSALQDIRCLLRNRKVHLRARKNSPLVTILSQIKPAYTPNTVPLEFVLILSSHLHEVFQLFSSLQEIWSIILCISHTSHMCCMLSNLKYLIL